MLAHPGNLLGSKLPGHTLLPVPRRNVLGTARGLDFAIAANAELLGRPRPWAGLLRLASPRAALVVGLATLLLTAAGVPLTIMSHAGSSGLPLVPFASVGYIVTRRQPRNPIGWILLGLAFVFLLASDAGSYAFMDYRQGYHLPLPRAAAFLAAFWIWLVILGPLPIALFPDGRLSRLWRWILWGYLAVCTSVLVDYTWLDVAEVGARHVRIDAQGALSSTDASSGDGALTVALVAFWVIAVLRQVLNYRRASGEYRQQLKWLLSGAVISIVGLLLGGVGFFAVIALPIAMGVSILKYRLYEIDRLISRTLSYVIITGLLAGVFVGIVVLTTHVLPFSSPVGVAASTLAAAALFNPLRLRVQRLVDRRFNRARYDAEAIVAAFTMRLRDAVDLETVRNELLQAVDRAVEPAHASVWIRPSEQH